MWHNILIVKTSSLGDIIQAFHVLDDLTNRFPKVAIDWAAEASFCQIVAAHPLVRKTIPIDMKNRRNLWSAFCALRQEKYDLVFDLQGNCKSGLITFLSRGKVKIGYGFKSVREWPNLLATNKRFNVSKERDIRSYYLGLIENYFKEPATFKMQRVRFKIDDKEKRQLAEILSRVSTKCIPQPPENLALGLSESSRDSTIASDSILLIWSRLRSLNPGALAKPNVQVSRRLGYKIMVCPGSKWINKQLRADTLASFLQKIAEAFPVSFLLVSGDESEKTLCKQLHNHLPHHSILAERLSIPTWQNLMNEMDLVIAMDSSALHLCGTTRTPSFSVFGPTSSDIFKPLGEQHFAFQGSCPYNRVFAKQCPVLRTCATGACIRELKAEDLFKAFMRWISKVRENQCEIPQL